MTLDADPSPIPDAPDFGEIAQRIYDCYDCYDGTDFYYDDQKMFAVLRDVDAKAYERGRASRNESLRVLGEQSIANGELVALHEAENAALRSQIATLEAKLEKAKAALRKIISMGMGPYGAGEYSAEISAHALVELEEPRI